MIDYVAVERLARAELGAASSSVDAMTRLIAVLKDRVAHYSWVGVYLLDGEELVLGPYLGKPSPHTRIPLGQGICGAAAATKSTIVVDDVNSDPRYLACSIETKSEIVVPVFVRGKVAGELDIDSHFLAAFGPDDRKLCEHAAAVLGKFLETHAQ